MFYEAKPDDYYFDGIVEMARFGTNTLMNFHCYQLTDIKDNEKDCLYEKGKQRAERLLERHRTLIGKKIGRNEPCPCGSGKKYKKCCGSNKN